MFQSSIKIILPKNGINFIGLTNQSTSAITKISLSTNNVVLSFESSNNTSLGFVKDNYADSQFELKPDIILGNRNDFVAASNYMSYLLLRIEYKNKGLASQQCKISQQILYQKNSDTKASLLTAAKNFVADVTTGFLDFNDGVSAYDIPSAFYIKWPFTRSLFRLHSFLIKGYKN
jgi:hypothetical protein